MTRLLVLLLLLPAAARGAVHYSGDQFRELPARWNGYLPDLRALRTPAGPLFDRYRADLAKLDAVADPTADQLADRGALLLRLGQPDKALAVLRPAARRFPDHFRTAAHLGTAWQTLGDLPKALDALDEAARLAPADQKPLEELHRTLVRSRMTNSDGPDRLFPGKPPADAVARVQQLCLSLPADGRLLWTLAEVAAAAGEERAAAALLDGCVTEFGMSAPKLRERRQELRAKVDAMEKAGHTTANTLVFRSPRAFRRLIDPAALPPPADGVNMLPWSVVGETEIDGRGRATFLDWLGKLDGRRVELAGFATPVGTAEPTVGGFLLTEAAVGCWFCEVPGPTQVVRVALADGVSVEPPRGAVRVTGVLRLNRSDPEGLPVVLAEASVRPAD